MGGHGRGWEGCGEDLGPQRTVFSTCCVHFQPALCPASAPWTAGWTVPAFYSQDTALTGLSPFLCSEPQFCLHWSWALSPPSSASDLLSAFTGPISTGPPSPPQSQCCHPLRHASAGSSPYSLVACTHRARRCWGTSHSCSA